ncbi:MAG: hypothetical protein JO263_00410, partial [Candidatus Eremiobacteraeota bacterium]|nr:hypothetical protein [Candidatus Eremiobacteraeota bacterium]
KIANGFVSTFAGRPKRGRSDGRGKDARFNTPESLAFDDDGNLYVADFGNGIRKITPAGEVTTLNLPSDGGDVIAIDVRGRAPNLTIAYTENLALHLIEGSRSMVLRTGDRIEPWDEFKTASTFYGVAILGEGTVAITDVLDNAVRLVRFPGPPFFIGTMELPLGGGVHEGEPHGLFRDGPAAEARFDVPLGIARMPDGNLLVADGGNRRIRLVSGADPRGPVRADLKGLVGPAGAYRVAVLGNSFAFHDVLWSESIAGQIEAGLKRDRFQLGLSGEPFVSTARLDAADISDLRSFATNYLGDGEADLVVLLVDEYNQKRELQRRPEIEAGNRWQKTIPAELRAFQAALAKHGTQLLVVVLPKGRGEAIAELPHESVQTDGMVDAVNFEQDRQRAQNLERFYESTGVRTLGLQGPVERAEETQSRVQLYNAHDNHFSPEGQTLIGREILSEIERWRPWTKR